MPSSKQYNVNADTCRWAIFAALAAAYFLVYFHRLSLSVVADTLVEEFATSAGVIGLLGSVYFYCYAVMQLPAGLLADSVGPRKTVAFSLMIAALGSVLFGFSPNLETAFIGRILVGFGAAMVFIPTMKILSQWFRPREFAFMAGILNAVGGVGVMAATWVLAVMTMHLGWRVSFEIIGGVTLVVVLANWLISRITEVHLHDYGCTLKVYRREILAEMRLKGLVFFDAGGAYEDFKKFGQLRYTSGAGIRWISPMGPIRIEWGYNLNQKPGESSNKFEFAFGSFF